MTEIHLVLYASQPDIQRACDSQWSTPAWKTEGKPPLPAQCYWSDDDWAYTFEKSLTTCPECLKVHDPT